MGIFSRMKKNARDVQTIANAVAKVVDIIDDIDDEPKLDDVGYLIAAWICRVGILDVLETSSMLMTNTVFVVIKGHITKMTLREALFISVGRLSLRAGGIGGEFESMIMSILDKGEWFYQVDKHISTENKAALFNVLFKR